MRSTSVFSKHSTSSDQQHLSADLRQILQFDNMLIVEADAAVG